MNPNPLVDIIENTKQLRLENDIKEIKGNLQTLIKERNNMEKLIELGLLQNSEEDLAQKKVSINPKYIAYVEEDEGHAFVHMSNESVLHTVESRNEILKLIEGSTNQTYIS
jgi:hypothetical protein